MTAPSEAAAPISERIGESPTEMLNETAPPENFTEPGPEPSEPGPEYQEYEGEPVRESSFEERVEKIEEQPPARGVVSEAPAREPERYEPAPAPASKKEEGSAVSQAIQKVLVIMDELKESMDQMEQVLELLEEAERQQMVDERELRNLQRSLESMHRGRSEHSRGEHGRGGDHGRRHHEHRGPQR